MEFQRLFPRVRVAKPCHISWEDGEVSGHIKDASYGGVAAELPQEVTWRNEEATMVLSREGVTLRVRPVRYECSGNATRVGFFVRRVQHGERRWRQLTGVPRW